MTDEEHHAHVDITITRETMLAVRDELRLRLIKQYHLLLLLARTSRKVGKHESARRQQAEAKKTAMMIWCLDNPMAGLTAPGERRNEGADQCGTPT